MKITRNKNFFSRALMAGLTVTTLLMSCKKDFDNQIEAAGIAIIHASPDAPALDFIVDNTKANSKTFMYNDVINYLAAYPGIRQFGITYQDSTRLLIKNNFNLKPGQAYSAFIADTLGAAKFVVLEDDLSLPENDKAKIRFVNLSPNSPALGLSLQGQTEFLLPAKEFTAFTEFGSIDPAENYTFEIKESAGGPVKATLENIKIEKGKIYTIWAKGLSSKTDSTGFSAAIMTNR